jgi:methionine synthase / methylenetetrahydrofolate reductase(NADPH)
VNAREQLRARLEQRPIVADGAFGTLLFSRGIPQRASLDELATTRPDLVGAIHREYIEAGADLIETGTFGANRHRLQGFGLADQVHRFNRRAVQVAREARDVAGREVLVGGSVGPLGAPTRELLHLEERVVRSIFREQIDGLLEGGVDAFVLETFIDLRHLLLAIDEVRRATSELPIIAELTFGEELALPDGTTPEVAAAALFGADVDVIGVNCGVGPQACLDGLRRMSHASGGPVGPSFSIMPNAGLPQRIEGEFVYAADAAYFGTMAPDFLEAGARILGGCCGTMPAHIAAIRAAVDQALGVASPVTGERAEPMGMEPKDVLTGPRTPARDRAPTSSAAPASATAAATAAAPPAPAVAPGGPSATGMPAASAQAGADDDAPPPTRLASALAEGHFVISVEIDPPRSIRIDRTLEAARLLQAAGVDVVNVSDSAMARVRMGALPVALGIQHDVDLECIIHFTTRDRNLMAIESELLGAHALGVRNILALTGDPPRVGDYPTGTGVWDVDSVGLVEILARLNRGEDQAGSPIGQRAGFLVCCALDPTAADGPREWERLHRKLEKGAQLVMTQPLYSVAQVEAMMTEARRRFGPAGFPVPVLLGVLPLQSARHAEFLHNEVPGITIPDDTRAALHDAGDRGAEVGLEITIRLLEQVAPLVAGTYIMPSFGRYQQAAELVRRLRAWLAPAAAPAGRDAAIGSARPRRAKAAVR